ncbi:MAG: hypothetical protein V1831_02900 [Candidatus Woesearchaeota archaeon]
MAINSTQISELENEIIKSVFDHLPDNAFTNFLENLNSIMSETLKNYISDNIFTHFFIANPLIILILFFILTAAIAIFLDFIQDAWKIPFAVIMDIIDLMAIASPGVLDFIAAVGSFLVFFILARDTGNFKYIFGGIGATKCLIPINAVSIFPVNTVLMVIAAIIDK